MSELPLSLRHRYFLVLLRHRWTVLGLLLGILAFSVYGSAKVQVDYDVEDFFPARDPARQTYQTYKESFSKEDTQVSVFYRPGPKGLDHDGYQVLQGLAIDLEQVGLHDVTWIGNVDVAQTLQVDEFSSQLSVGPMLAPGEWSDQRLKQVLTQYKNEPLYRGVIWNPAQTVFAVHGHLDAGDNNAQGRGVLYSELAAKVAERIRQLEENGEIVLGGIPVIRAQGLELINQDMVIFMGLGVLLMGVILYLILRNVGQVALTLVAILPSYLVTVGIMGFAERSISMLTSFIPILILVVGVCDTLHILVHYRRSLLGGKEPRVALVDSFSDLLVPCFYTSLTTAIGFLSLMTTGIEVVVEFGLFTALAVALTFAFSMTLFPILLSFAGKGAKGADPRQVAAQPPDNRDIRLLPLGWTIDRARECARRPRLLPLALAGLAVVVSIGLAHGLRVDALMVDDIDPNHPVMRDLAWVEENGFGLFQVNIWLRANGGEVLHEAATIAWMEELQRWAEGEDKVVINTLSVADYLKQIRGALFDGDPKAAVLPASRDEAAQLLLLADMNSKGFVRDVYLEGRNEAQVVLVVRDAGSTEILPFLERLHRRLEGHPPPLSVAVSTGTVELAQRVYSSIVRGFGGALLLAVVAIFLLMAWMFRSIPQGLVALVPNFLPLAVLMGLMRLVGWDLKPSTMLVFSIAFGIAVDDTIHLLGGLRHGIRQGLHLDEALDRALQASGHAIVLTSLVIGAGFSVLLGSRFTVLSQLGLMCMVTVLVALVADLFVYPTLLRLTLGRNEGRGHSKAAQIEGPLTRAGK